MNNIAEMDSMSIDKLAVFLKKLEDRRWEHAKNVYSVFTDEETHRKLCEKFSDHSSTIVEFLNYWEIYRHAVRIYEDKTGKNYAAKNNTRNKIPL
jgi:hypothetical protein